MAILRAILESAECKELSRKFPFPFLPGEIAMLCGGPSLYLWDLCLRSGQCPSYGCTEAIHHL